MKILKPLLMVFAILILTGCNCKTEYIEVPKPYAVPTPCVTPDVVCDVNGSDANVVIGLLKCVVDYKKSNEVCK